MKASVKWWLIAAVLVVLGFAVAIPWAIICLATAGVLVANGAWFLAVLLLGSAVAAVVSALREERDERLREDDAIYARALELLGKNRSMTFNEAHNLAWSEARSDRG